MSNLEVEIGADPSGLGRGLERAQQMIENFVNRVERIGEIGEKLSAIGQRLTVSLTLPIVGLGGAAIKAYGDIEALQKGLEAVMGSATLATSEFSKLKEVAKLPGLGMEEAVKGSINLQSIGISANKSRNILMQFGNAVATVGKGRAEFERAVYGVQQLANTDFPLGEDLNIIKDALPQVSNLLKEAFGTSRSDELADLGISSKKVLDTILTGLEKLPRVTGGIKGAFENLGDSIKTSLGRVGKIINDNFNITQIVDKITDVIDKVVTAFENLDPTIQKSILVIAGLAASIGPLIAALGLVMQSIPTLVAGVGALSSAFTFLTGPIGLVTVAIVGIVAAVVANWDKIRPYIEETIDRFKRLYNESQAFRAIVGSIGFAFEVWARIAFEALKGIYQNFKIVGKGILEIWSGIGSVVEGVFTGNFTLLKEGLNKAAIAISNTASNSLVNNLDVLKRIGAAIEKTEQKWSNLRFDTSKKTDLSFNGALESSVEKEVAEGVKKGLKKTKVKEIEIPAIEPVKTQLKGLLDEFGNYHDTVNSLFSAEAQRDLMVNSTVLPAILDEQYQNVLKAKERMSEVVGSFNQNVSTLLNQEITNGIVNAMSALGNAFATGGNAVEAIGLSLLSSVGSILVELGKQAIAAGVGLIAIKAALKSLNPYVAIAAGAALVALGSFVGSNVSKIGSSMGSGGSGSSGGGSVSTGTGADYSGNTYSSNYSSGGSYGGGGEVVFRLSGYELKGVLDRVNGKNDRLNAGN
jgi:tape measure domain-containing protein